MKYAFMLCAVILCLGSCSKPQLYCGVKNPVRDLAWLKERIANDPATYDIYKLKYKNTEGFYFLLRPDVCCDQFTAIYTSCDGTTLYSSGGFAGFNTFPGDFDSNGGKLVYP